MDSISKEKEIELMALKLKGVDHVTISDLLGMELEVVDGYASKMDPAITAAKNRLLASEVSPETQARNEAIAQLRLLATEAPDGEIRRRASVDLIRLFSSCNT